MNKYKNQLMGTVILPIFGLGAYLLVIKNTFGENEVKMFTCTVFQIELKNNHFTELWTPRSL